ncbi:MAG TPA: hypothetical protein PLJ20_04490 [Candidatus Contendobacter sp.]|nr:hypothetical protein [Candidatus Contendobacter sp.]
MKRSQIIAIVISLLGIGTASAQTLYKCPAPTPGAPPIIQQMPCSPTGGGETMTVKPIPTGAGAGLSDEAKAYLKERDQYRAEQAKAAQEEQHRAAALAAEHRKAAAAEDQAAAQRATARAIWATGLRR